MNANKRTYRDYQEDLVERLKDPVEALSYLRAALADEDERIFLLAVRDVLQAKGENIPLLAEKTDLNKQNLYKMLSKAGNPRFNSLKTVLHAVGFEISLNSLKN
jgi:probable addiction module antidote protein